MAALWPIGDRSLACIRAFDTSERSESSIRQLDELARAGRQLVVHLLRPTRAPAKPARVAPTCWRWVGRLHSADLERGLELELVAEPDGGAGRRPLQELHQEAPLVLLFESARLLARPPRPLPAAGARVGRPPATYDDALAGERRLVHEAAAQNVVQRDAAPSLASASQTGCGLAAPASGPDRHQQVVGICPPLLLLLVVVFLVDRLLVFVLLAGAALGLARRPALIPVRARAGRLDGHVRLAHGERDRTHLDTVIALLFACERNQRAQPRNQ